jgi:hypothetical protein
MKTGQSIAFQSSDNIHITIHILNASSPRPSSQINQRNVSFCQCPVQFTDRSSSLLTREAQHTGDSSLSASRLTFLLRSGPRGRPLDVRHLEVPPHRANGTALRAVPRTSTTLPPTLLFSRTSQLLICLFCHYQTLPHRMLEAAHTAKPR